jgi:hypothetical protein
MWKNFWHNAGWLSPMKRCGNGVSHLGRRLPTNCVVAVTARATNGTWMRSSSLLGREALSVASRGSGWQTSLIFLSRAGGTNKLPNDFRAALLKKVHYVPRVIITDKLKSYAAAKRDILPGVEHRQHKGLNNRAENSHQPLLLREKKASGKYPRSTSSQPLGFEPFEESFSMMAKTEAIKLFVMLGTGTASHRSSGAACHLPQMNLQLLNSLRVSTPPFIVGHATAITQHVTVPVLTPTNATIARFDGANAAFEIIVGARKVLHIVTAHPMGAHVQKGSGSSLVCLLCC